MIIGSGITVGSGITIIGSSPSYLYWKWNITAIKTPANNMTQASEFIFQLGFLRPQFLDKYSNQLNIDHQDREDFQLPNRTPEEHQEYIKTKYPPVDEETTTASIKSLVKIAQKLDNKNLYKLADKITNYITKKLVY